MNFNFGVFDLPWWGYVLVTLAMTHVTIATVTIYYHRTQAHRALDLNQYVEYFFRLVGWMTTGMIVKEWVAIHRKHHAKDDGPEDPHSPQVYGIWRILFFGVERYYVAAKDASLIARYGHGTPRDWLERRVFMKYPWLGVVLMLTIDLILFGPVGLFMWGIQMIWIPFWAAGVVNGVGHWPLFRKLFCYRNNDTKDASANIVPWGILIGGEELHNNHHANPYSAKLSLQWYEFDIGWVYIRILESFNLAKVKYLPPVEDESRNQIDDQTIAVLRADNGYVESWYRSLLLYVALHELQDEKFAGVAGILGEVVNILQQAKWNSHTLVAAEVKIQQLKVTRSLLPRIGEFIALFAEIKKSAREVGATTKDREQALISHLREWAASLGEVQIPKVQAFAKSLMRLVMFRSV